jgi:hypothetical protein
MKTCLNWILLSWIAISTYAQGELKFQKISHDFGQLEEGIQAKMEFIALNTGDKPVHILSAQPSCGCTVSEFTKSPIDPGKTGRVNLLYNTSGRPGSFTKSVTVSTDGKTPVHILSIQGSVLPKSELVAVDPEKLKRSPRIALSAKEYSFGKLEKGKMASTSFIVKNEGKSDLRISSLSSPCQCTTYTLSRNPLSPGDTATLQIQFTPLSVRTYNEGVHVFSNDLSNPKPTLMLKAEVLESLVPTSIVKEAGAKPPF